MRTSRQDARQDVGGKTRRFFLASVLVGAGMMLGPVASCTGLSCGTDGGKTPEGRQCWRVYAVSEAFDTHQNELNGLTRANDRFNEVANERFCLEPSTDRPNNAIRRIPYGGPEWQELSKRFNGLNVIGVYSSGDRIGIVDGLTDEVFYLVALHELGHARGLKHTPAPSIMHASVGTAKDFTPNDYAECQRVDACPGADSLVLVAEDGDDCVLVLLKPAD